MSDRTLITAGPVAKGAGSTPGGQRGAAYASGRARSGSQCDPSTCLLRGPGGRPALTKAAVGRAQIGATLDAGTTSSVATALIGRSAAVPR